MKGLLAIRQLVRRAVLPSDVTVSVAPNSTLPAGMVLNADGTISVPSGTATGSYTINYQICDKVNPGNCATATATVIVATPLVPDINVNISASGTIINIGKPLQLFFAVNNVGTGNTNGVTPITLTVTLPTVGTGTARVLSLPAGWSVQSQSTAQIVFVRAPNFIMQPAASNTIVIDYTSNDAIGIGKAFTATIANGSGGEINYNNNTKTQTFLISALAF